MLADRGLASHPKRELRDNTAVCKLLRDYLLLQHPKTPAAARLRHKTTEAALKCQAEPLNDM